MKMCAAFVMATAPLLGCSPCHIWDVACDDSVSIVFEPPLAVGPLRVLETAMDEVVTSCQLPSDFSAGDCSVVRGPDGEVTRVMLFGTTPAKRLRARLKEGTELLREIDTELDYRENTAGNPECPNVCRAASVTLPAE